MSELVQVAPHATIACGAVPNWRAETAAAERAAVSVAASNNFFTIKKSSFQFSMLE